MVALRVYCGKILLVGMVSPFFCKFCDINSTNCLLKAGASISWIEDWLGFELKNSGFVESQNHN